MYVRYYTCPGCVCGINVVDASVGMAVDLNVGSTVGVPFGVL